MDRLDTQRWAGQRQHVNFAPITDATRLLN
jgi:hypothetical protein